MYHQQTNWSQQTIKQTKVIQEVVLQELSKLNHAVLNKKQGHQIQLSPAKKIEKRKRIYHSCQIIIPGD